MAVEPSKVAVATGNNNELKSEKCLLLKIKQHTYSSSSDYKMSTGKQLQGLGTSSSYKLCREIVITGKQGTLLKKGSLEGTLSRKEICEEKT